MTAVRPIQTFRLEHGWTSQWCLRDVISTRAYCVPLCFMFYSRRPGGIASRGDLSIFRQNYSICTRAVGISPGENIPQRKTPEHLFSPIIFGRRKEAGW